MHAQEHCEAMCVASQRSRAPDMRTYVYVCGCVHVCVCASVSVLRECASMDEHKQM